MVLALISLEVKDKEFLVLSRGTRHLPGNPFEQPPRRATFGTFGTDHTVQENTACIRCQGQVEYMPAASTEVNLQAFIII